jgi:hypothetical protein
MNVKGIIIETGHKVSNNDMHQFLKWIMKKCWVSVLLIEWLKETYKR